MVSRLLFDCMLLRTPSLEAPTGLTAAMGHHAMGTGRGVRPSRGITPERTCRSTAIPHDGRIVDVRDANRVGAGRLRTVLLAIPCCSLLGRAGPEAEVTGSAPPVPAPLRERAPRSSAPEIRRVPPDRIARSAHVP